MSRGVKELDFEFISKLFYYDKTSKSGLRNKTNRGQKIKASTQAGGIQTNERGHQSWKVQVSGKVYLVHRLVYLLNHGSISSDLQIDHIDGNSLNNNIENLRLVSSATNTRNAKMRKDNTTGTVGVSYDKIQERYVADYYDINEKFRAKYFSCKKLGVEQAFKLACEYRTNAIISVNTELVSSGYTNRHGKRTIEDKPENNLTD